VPEKLPGTKPMALLIVAVTGEKPKDTRMGNVINVPLPTMALIAPAAAPASRMAAISTALTVRPQQTPSALR
jgi:hypothetical protein